MEGLLNVFNKEEVSKLSFANFSKLYAGNSYLAKQKIDIKKAFKYLGGTIERSTKTSRKSK